MPMRSGASDLKADVNGLLDFSDRVFFDAYADDIKKITVSLRFR